MTREHDEERTGATDASGLTSSDPGTPPTWWTEIVTDADQDTRPAASPAAPPVMPSRRTPSPADDDDSTQALPTYHVPTPKAQRRENQPPPPRLEHRIPFAGPAPVVPPAPTASPASAPADPAAAAPSSPSSLDGGPDDDATQALPSHQMPKPRLRRPPATTGVAASGTAATEAIPGAAPLPSSAPTLGSAPRPSSAPTPSTNRSWSLSEGTLPTGPVPTEGEPSRRERRRSKGAAPVASVARAGRPPLTRGEKRLGLVAAGLVVVIALIGLFIVGTRLAPAPEVVSAPTPTVTALPVPPAADALPAGPLEPGTYEWTELAGGECLDPYTGPWEEEFTVVDCEESHPAQLVFRGSFLEDDDPTAFPGVDALQQQIALLCSTPGAIDLDIASGYRDLQLEGSFPVTAEEWDAGHRDYYCFASRSSGEPLEGSIAAGGE